MILEKIESMAASVGAFALHQVLPAVVTLVIGILAIRVILNLLRQFLEKSKLEKAAHSLICSLTTVVLYLLLGLIVASGLGIDVTGIIALASVLTLAVSLSVQNALTNVIGGFTLLYTHPFKSGDYVDIAGRSGTVEEISMTYTKLTTPDNKVISIPNSAVVAGDIVNYSVAGTRRVDIQVSASYDAPVQKVLDTLTGILPVILSNSSRTREEEALAMQVRKARHLRLVYQFEQPAKQSKLFPRAFDPADMQMEIRRELKAVDPHACVIEASLQHRVCWNVR